METQEQPVRILLVEDEPRDQRIIKRFLEKTRIRNELVVLEDGQQGLDYLKRQADYEERGGPQPHLVLLDLHLPKKTGHEVLEELNEWGELNRIPVVILTTSSEGKMIEKSYELGARSHIEKPVDMEQFSRVIQSIEDYWFQIVSLPSE